MHWWWSSWWLRQSRNSLRRRSLCQWLFWVKMFQKPRARGHSSPTHMPHWQSRGGQPHKHVGSLTVTQREVWSSYHLIVPLLFFIFFPFSIREECIWAALTWHNYQCNCSFEKGFQHSYEQRYIRKGNVTYPLVNFYNLLLRRCDFGPDRLGMYV